MKIRQAWKMWVMDDDSKRYPRALRTIETRTRRYYRNQARKARKKGNITMYRFYNHQAASPYTLEDTLFKDQVHYVRAGKSYHIW